MNKYIALMIAAVAIAGGVFLFTKPVSAPPSTGEDKSAPVTPVTLSPVFSFTHVADTPIAIEAWQTFLKYLGFAKAHDLKGLQSLSYQLSPTCQAALTDPKQVPECNKLMDSLYFFTSDFREKDFTHVAYDDKQIVLSTDYLKVNISSSTDQVKTVIYFIRATSTPKVLGIRFCLGKEEVSEQCVRTSPSTRDANKNGWWDDVEAFFNK